MRLSALLLLLAFSLVLPASAGGWSRHENRELIQGSRPGWALETPPEWIDIADVKPPWPLGAGFRDPSGRSGVVVTWVAKLPGGELDSLKTRGYAETGCRLAGHDARLFTRNSDGRVQRFAYLTAPEGVYRVTLFGTSDAEQTLDQILRSFQLVTGLSPTGPEKWATHQDPAGFQLSYPGGWSVKSGSAGFDLASAKGVAVRAALRKGDAAQSFRGFARSIGKTTIPGASSLERFEPVDAGGATGYLAVWKLASGELYGPVVYLPLSGGRSLELTLLEPEAGDEFFRIVDSFRAQ